LKQVYRRTEKRYSYTTNFNTGCKFDVISKLYDFNEKLSRDSYSDIGVIIKLKSMWLDRPNLLVIAFSDGIASEISLWFWTNDRDKNSL